MNAETVNKLRELNNRFYEQNAQSFSETRQQAWPGWDRVLAIAREPAHSISRVLDVAGGNLRFEDYCLQNGFSHTKFYVVDSCPALAKSIDGVSFQDIDIVDCLARGKALGEALNVPLCDLVVCFGFAHHVPDERLRVSFVRQLVELLTPEGIIALTFWQFAKDQSMKAKADATTEIACNEFGLHVEHDLDEGDYILGWKDVLGAYRYCHSFADAEIDSIAEAVSKRAEVIDMFSSDGKSGRMNKYLILKGK